MKRFGKHLALCVAVLSLVLATACSKDNNGAPGASESPSASPSASVTPAPESPSASPSAVTPEVIESTGEYIGLMDSHSIEIKTENGPTPFQIDAATAEKLSDWEQGTPVKFQYKEEKLDANGEQVKQNVIVSIDKQ
jgi:hypothetical protein